MAWHSLTLPFIFFLSEGNGLTFIPHGLHLDTCMLQSFLKVWISLQCMQCDIYIYHVL